MHKGNISPDQNAELFARFDAIVANYEGALLRYATRLLNNTNAAQDVVQMAFIKLLRSWKADSEPSPQLSAWLYRVTHNAAVDYLRHESRHRAMLSRHAEERSVTDFSAEPHRDISDQAVWAVRALHTLSLREQQLVILKVYEQKSYREISDITALSQGNVGYILHHAMRKLADTFKELKANQGELNAG
ncbi:MAG: sigma-70 family RNA polymerase sigma factor [Lentisphaerales bacterium]|jgi:RNA polymerase sigma-70 factor (ECF subfamily)|nr:MAG: sigma-70 family RNA polymerase sigma factor [Lentisphaerales bacterium]